MNLGEDLVQSHRPEAGITLRRVVAVAACELIDEPECIGGPQLARE